MNKFFEFFKSLFDLSDEQIEKAELELKNTQKSDGNGEKTPEAQGKGEKESEGAKNGENGESSKSDDVKDQSAGATPELDKGGEDMKLEDIKKLQDELAAMKALLETTQAEKVAEKRKSKIESIKDCVDYGVLTSLLEGVEEKDIDAKVAEIQKDKGYLFKAKETDGFNPATPQNSLSGVEAAFFDLNPDLKG